ncbi:MAG: hypothetical protein ACXWFY_06285 [Chthoniobacterales bacterium]
MPSIICSAGAIFAAIELTWQSNALLVRVGLTTQGQLAFLLC